MGFQNKCSEAKQWSWLCKCCLELKSYHFKSGNDASKLYRILHSTSVRDCSVNTSNCGVSQKLRIYLWWPINSKIRHYMALGCIGKPFFKMWYHINAFFLNNLHFQLQSHADKQMNLFEQATKINSLCGETPTYVYSSSPLCNISSHNIYIWWHIKTIIL